MPRLGYDWHREGLVIAQWLRAWRVYHTPAGLAFGHYGKWTNVDRARITIGALFLVAPDGTAFVAAWDGSFDVETYHDLRRQLLALLQR